jgi:F-type H+-transporting ATPase subunit b
VQIDWLTVGAQWINFLILMWLLRRFLYQPIIRAMDRRQQAIASRAQEAQQEAEQAQRLAQDYRDKLAELEDLRIRMLTEAREQAKVERENLLQQARAESQKLSARWRQEIEREKADFQNQLSRKLGHLIISTASKAVQDLSGLEWEQTLFGHFIERLQQLPEQDKNRLSASTNDGLTLASSFKLDESMRNSFRDALNHTLAAETNIRFETIQNSPAGLRLSSSGYSVEWSIEDYFAHLDTELEAMLAQANPSLPRHHVE